MKALYDLIAGGENWIIHRLWIYTTTREYSKYSSTLEEAWRVSIRGLSAPLLKATEMYASAPELHPDEDIAQDPIASFGIIEAERHRERGVSLGMFLGLLKYYRQTYVDLVEESDLQEQDKRRYRLFVERFFDRVEIGVAVEWAKGSDQERIGELQATNRFLTNEKNKYLTIFESQTNPVFLLDKNNRIDNVNHGAAEFLGRSEVPGSEYYCLLRDRSFEYQDQEKDKSSGTGCLQGESIEKILPWLQSELADFSTSGESEKTLEKLLEGEQGTRYVSVHLSKMLDISQKFAGSLVIIEDITLRRQAEKALTGEQVFKGALLENMVDGVVACDADGKLALFNRSAREWHGLDPTAISAEKWADYYDLYCQDGITPMTEATVPLARAFRGEVLRDEEMVIRAKGQPVRHILANCAPVCDEKSAKLGAVAIMHDITDRKRAEEEVKASLKEKEVLLKEIHHRVKNNLAVINSIINLQTQFAGQRPPKELFQEIQSRIRSMALAHELVYQSENLAEVSVARYVTNLLNYLQHSISTTRSEIHFVRELEDVSFSLDTVVPLGFIVTELVSNCLKHAFVGRDKGRILIKLRSADYDQYELVVSDNGIGIPEHIDIDDPKSVGLELVSTFVEQLDGNVTITRRDGTEVRIRFKERGLDNRRKT